VVTNQATARPNSPEPKTIPPSVCVYPAVAQSQPQLYWTGEQADRAADDMNKERRPARGVLAQVLLIEHQVRQCRAEPEDDAGDRCGGQ
jgi:hypothetical protein